MNQDAVNRAMQYQKAVLAQLNAERVAADFDVKKLAEAVGKDYNTFRRYMNGERELPINLLWQVLDVLAVTPDVFTDRARRRLEQR